VGVFFLGSLPVLSHLNEHTVRPLTSSEFDMALVCDLWKEIFPQWPISPDRLKSLLPSKGIHFIHEEGFCLSYLNKSERKGSIACIGVREAYRGRGLGTSLLNAARQNMRFILKEESDSPELLGIGVHSVFPRFWPGIPSSFPLKEREFFLHRGFQKSSDPIARDLYRDITGDVAPPEVLARVAKVSKILSTSTSTRINSGQIYDHPIT